MNHNVIETVLGAVVLIVAGIFLTMALGAANVKSVNGYEVSANFAKIDGINPGLDVRISGVKVGSILKAQLDPKTYQARVTMSIQDGIELPTDTVAKISSEGLLGGKYMSLEPGADDQMIAKGGMIEYTQASLNLEEMIGKFIFSSADKKKEAPVATEAAAEAAPKADPFTESAE